MFYRFLLEKTGCFMLVCSGVEWSKNRNQVVSIKGKHKWFRVRMQFEVPIHFDHPPANGSTNKSIGHGTWLSRFGSRSHGLLQLGCVSGQHMKREREREILLPEEHHHVHNLLIPSPGSSCLRTISWP